MLKGDDARGGGFALFLRPHPGAFRQLTCPHPGEFTHFKKNGGLAPGGWALFELVDALQTQLRQEIKKLPRRSYTFPFKP